MHQQFKRILSRQPGQKSSVQRLSHLRFDLSTVLIDAGQVADAASHERAEQEMFPNNPELHIQRAWRFLSVQRAPEAVASARNAVECGSDLPLSWFTLVLCLGLIKASAEQEYRRAAEGLLACWTKNPNATMAEWMTMACSLGAQRHNFVAGMLHAACVDRFPAATNYYNFGVTCHRMGQLELAGRCYTQAIALERRSTLALVNRGWIYFESGDLGRVKDDWSTAVAIDPDHAACAVPTIVLQGDLDRIRRTPDLANKFMKVGRDRISLTYHL
jgi:tetratricopeptide (TPR) repeat protein